jgi:mono/diheme cytochrome c family protein
VALAGAAVVAVLPAVSPQAQDAPGGISSVEIASEGRGLYEQVCQACHMADARGGGGAGASIPALAGNPKMADKDYAIGILVHGRGGMPWFTDILTPEQMATVLTYVRSDFNAYEDPVTAAEVERIVGEAGAPSGLE